MSSTGFEGLEDFYRGDTKTYNIQLLQKTIIDDIEVLTPLSVDGGELFVTFKSDQDMSDEDAEIKKQETGVEPDPENPTGLISITLSDEDTEVEPGSYFFDFQFVFPDGTVKTISPPIDTEEENKKVTIAIDTTRRIV